MVCWVEVGWGTAFRQALAYVVYSIVWAIVGGALLAVGGRTLYTAFTEGGVPEQQLAVSVGLVIAGVIVLALGSLAAFFKALSGIIYEILKKYHEKQ